MMKAPCGDGRAVSDLSFLATQLPFLLQSGLAIAVSAEDGSRWKNAING